MNELLNLNSGMSSVFGSNVAGLGTPLMPQASPQGEEFQDILGLVNNMSLADEQSGVLGDTIDEGSKKLIQDSSLVQMQLAAMQGALAPQVGKQEAVSTKANETLSVGQPASIQKPVETQSLQGIAQEMQMLSQLNLNAKKEALQGEPSQDAVEQWAAAFANNDIKGVVLEKDKPQSKIETRELGSDSIDLVAKANGSLENPNDLAGDLSKVVSLKAQPVQEKTVQGTKANSNEIAKASFESTKIDELARVKLGQDSKTETSDKKSGQGGQEKKPAVMSGQEFILQQGVATKASPSKDGVAALVGAKTLGESSDRRVSPESLNFVAERVEALKAQGGGTLRVDLNPRELGGIQIKVSMARSGLQVELIAERPDTMKMLQASREDLALRLKDISPTKIELGLAREMPQMAMDRMAKATQSAASSQEMLSLRGGDLSKAQATSSDLQNKLQPDFDRGTEARSIFSAAGGQKAEFSANGGGSMNSKQNFESGSQSRSEGEWNRDERREKAQDRWEEFLEGHRKSA